MASTRPKVALILTGGGARAAYQVGVLRGLAELIPEGESNPFPIICGTSAGAINAAALAADAADFRRAVRRLMVVWKHFQVQHIYRADPWGAFSNSARWILDVATGGAFSHRPVSLLDNSPLVGLLRRYIDFSAIQRSIDDGHLAALSITCSGYSSGQSVTFFQGTAGLQPWQRARRIGVPMTITLEHLLASSALPFIFPPVHINREYFGDGSMRQIAPVSPALHLGADRLLVIGTGRELPPGQERVRTEVFPSLAQIAGHALNSIFLDSLEVDLERLQRINRTIELISPEVLQKTRYPLHQVDSRMLAPSEELERIAVANAHELPRTIRLLLNSVGALRRSGANVLSYLLFEKSYCRALIRLGYEDTMQREEDLATFLGWHDSGV
ncbi:MAG: patatin-like phospholipase family protein [Betaproteobacteria bacterium]|nr:patatin-like phospholipase family protein [Betaproteobacteria bacterium]MDH3436253.1 patatin-like phospholipase family protein [Betaproteobacteria bacterium]